MSEAEKALLAAGVRKPTIIVDWDGTCVPSAWPERPTEWLFGARTALRAFLTMGYKVKIWTVRTHSSNFAFDGPNLERDNDIAYIRGMLDEAGFEDIEIELTDKAPADFYVDDRGVRHTNWPLTLAQVSDLHHQGAEIKGDVTDARQEVTA